MKIVVLGAGMVGSVIARDLARDGEFEVVSMDRREDALRRVATHGIHAQALDVLDGAALGRAVEGAAAVVNAVPGFLGFRTLRAVIEAGVPVVDIAFMPEDFFELDALAKAKGVPAVVDFGVAPGLSNLLVGRGTVLLDEMEQCEIVVGGLPLRRVKPWEYKAPFSPVDVLEEYTRPARLVEHGRVVEKPALSEIELIDLPVVGSLEAFNTDGLRTLIRTIDAPFMRERTLRYPGYAEKVKLLRDTGFLGTEPIDVGGVRVRPMDVAAKLLFDAWKLRDAEPEMTVMQVEVQGLKDGRPRRHVWDLYDEFDPATGMSSMARTTGFPAAIMARLLAHGKITEAGILPPETIGRNADLFAHIIAELKARSVLLTETIA
jgi:lysine 6-dehydrogenase